MQNESSPSLPEPDALSAAHAERVAAYIREQIAAGGGTIGFAEFMQHALYAPGLGYYVAGTTKFGPAGDFVTAPEVSSLFGRVVGRQCAAVLGQVRDGSVLEYGAGSGKLAVDVLQALADLGALPRRYAIVEVSADLRERQEQLLREVAPDLLPLVEWLSEPPRAHRGVILANEVLDALPFERFARRGGRLVQQRVTVADDGFAFVDGPPAPALADAVAAIESDLEHRLPDDYVSEVCLAAGPWIGGLADVLEEGIALLFDYGVSRREYYAPERSDGWLRCHFRHHAHNDPLVLTGIQDVTTWVDFTAVAMAASDAGLDVAGYSAQAQFLLGGGLDEEMQDFADLALEEQLELSRQVKTLTLPGEMGEHFKCMALRRGDVDTPAAFRLADRTHTL